MMDRLLPVVAVALAAFLTFVSPAAAQPPQPPPTATLGGYVAAPATTASARVALPVARTPFFTITLYNSGSNAAYFAVGDVTVVATTANTILRAGTRLTVWASGTHVAVITASSTSTVDIYQSNGPIDFGLVGGGGGGTAADITVGTTTVTGGVSGNVLIDNAGTLGTLSPSTTVNGQVCTLGSTCTITASATSITVGSTTISGGTTTNILRNSAGVLAEYTITGTGTVVAMQTSPSLVTPALGVATATSVAIGGGAIGGDALEITGSTTHNGAVVIASSSFSLSGNQSAAAWTTSGIRYKNAAATFTDTTSSGTVAAAYTNVFGGSTIAASAATTYTSYYNTYFNAPIAGTNVTMTNKSALGADSVSIGGAAQSTFALAVTGTSRFSSSVIVNSATNGFVVGGASPAGYAIHVGTASKEYFLVDFTGNTYWKNDSSTRVIEIISDTTGSGGPGRFALNNVSFIGFSSSTVAGAAAAATISFNAAGIVQFGTTAANASGSWLAAKGTITAGTLGDQAQAFSLTATQPTTPTGFQTAVNFDITSAGSAAQGNRAVLVQYNAGYTGSQSTRALQSGNSAAGTASTVIATAGSNALAGNFGLDSNSSPTTTGFNVGVNGGAQGGGTNVGVAGFAQVVKNGATNIGVVGSAINTGTTPVQIGGFFSLNQTTVPTVSAALIADNGSQTDAIFLARDNGTTVFTIADGGLVTMTGQLRITNIGSDAALTDTTVCQDTTNHQLYSGSGALGVCLGTSGRQFKTDFSPMTAGLSELMQIPLWNYRYLPGYGDNGKREQWGTTAQDIEKVLPKLVGYNDNGEAINYDYGALLFLSIRAIQELKADNDNLRLEIENVRRRASR